MAQRPPPEGKEPALPRPLPQTLLVDHSAFLPGPAPGRSVLIAESRLPLVDREGDRTCPPPASPAPALGLQSRRASASVTVLRSPVPEMAHFPALHHQPC